MASRDVNDLMPNMKDAAIKVRKDCLGKGVNLLIYCTLRSLEEQAKLYRQSRMTSEIITKIRILESKGFDFLAKVLKDVGSIPGKVGAHVTYVVPGESWHNLGMAFDAVPLQNGNPRWDTGFPGWKVYGECATAAGLMWGGSWTSFKDYPHCQLIQSGSPLNQYSPTQLRDLLVSLKLL